jgi:membrane protease subunit HflC
MIDRALRRPAAYGVAALAVVIVLANALYVLDQRKQAIILRFGEPIRVVSTPGLKLKVPFVENVELLDKRNQVLEASQEEIIDSDQQRLVVDAFVRYRINDPLQFYRTLRNEQNAASRLEPLTNSSLRQILGGARSSDIISAQRGALMRRARDDVAKRASESRLGVEILDLRIKRADQPDAVQESTFNRMRTARQQQAAQTRAVGEQNKRSIIAGADKEVAITLATATETAERVRGEGDARRAQVFGSAYGKDASFAAFYRSMQAYEAALGSGDTTMVLSPSSDFFKYFRGGPNAR